MQDPAKTASQIRQRCSLRPTLAIVLGSGFQAALGDLDVAAEIPYRELGGFPPVGVSGHAGKLVLGRFGTSPVLILNGRAHYYEGLALEQVTFPVRVLARFGIRAVLFTNAAGGISRKLRVGDMMCFSDHINLMGANPLRGPMIPDHPRFVDLTQTYDPQLNLLLVKAAAKAGLRMLPGVYLAVAGPSYETPAEVQAYARLGADAVGMSTVPEVIVSRQCGLVVSAMSCITNLAAGRSEKALSHSDVLTQPDAIELYPHCKFF